MSPTPILQFRGPHDYLSNFYLCKFTWEGIEWPHSEAAYQAAKFPRIYWESFAKMTPSESKKAGRQGQLRADWNDVKIDIMRSIVREKFCQNIYLLEWLLGTGKATLQEGNWWGDRFWGVSPAGSGNGRNELGKILMELRKEFRTALAEPQNQVIITYDHAPSNSLS